MTIHRSQAVSAATCMSGDFVRIVSAVGASYPQAAQLGPAIVLIANGMFGKIANQGGDLVLVPDERIPALLREIGAMKLSSAVQIERISVDQEHEKAIMGLQYLRQIADVARERATAADGTVQRGVMQALMGEAAGADLRRIVDELSAAGMHVVEKKVVRTYETNTIFLTTNPDAIREGRPSAEAMTFTTPTQEATVETFEVFDASRTRELLLSTQPVREVTAQDGELTPPLPAAQTNLMTLLGLSGVVSAEDIGLGDDLRLDDTDEGEQGPGMR